MIALPVAIKRNGEGDRIRSRTGSTGAGYSATPIYPSERLVGNEGAMSTAASAARTERSIRSREPTLNGDRGPSKTAGTGDVVEQREITKRSAEIRNRQHNGYRIYAAASSKAKVC